MTAKTKNISLNQTEESLAIEAERQTRRDALNATLIVSIAINAFILTGWLALRVTSQFDDQVASLLFN